MIATKLICLLSLITLVASISVPPRQPANLTTFARDEDLDHEGFSQSYNNPPQCRKLKGNGRRVCGPKVESIRLTVADNVKLRQGEQAIVQCQVKVSDSDGKVRIQWYLKDYLENQLLKLTNDTTERRFQIDDRSQKGKILSSLYINGALITDAGKYTCLATNGLEQYSEMNIDVHYEFRNIVNNFNMFGRKRM